MDNDRHQARLRSFRPVKNGRCAGRLSKFPQKRLGRRLKIQADYYNTRRPDDENTV